MTVGPAKETNLARAAEMAQKARTSGADLLALPEIFTCPYQVGSFADHAESYPDGQAFVALRELARTYRLTLVGGSVPELAGGHIYNASYVFGPHGELLGRHRKVHLFDADLPGGLVVRESDVLSPGQEAEPIETPCGRIGVVVCYDIRFPELIRRLVLAGAWLVLVPAAFNLVTGPAHWSLTLRARAVDNQIFVAGISRARVDDDPYVAYAHSLVVDPWGGVVAEAGTDEDLVVVEVDEDRVAEVRARLPLLAHRRPEVYTDRRPGDAI